MHLPRLSRRDALGVAAAGISGMMFASGGRAAAEAPGASGASGASPAGTNWAGNVAFSARAFHRPATVEELQQLVRDANAVHAVGGRHSFSDIADTRGTLVSLEHLRSVTVDREAATAEVGAGVKYSDLCPLLQAQGFAVENLASLPHICVVGACATATHGSGTQNLAASVVELQLVDGRGKLVTLAEGDAGFAGAVVGLGALGIVTQATLRLKPAFDVRQWVWVEMPLDAFVANLDEIFAAGYSVSGFTTWRDNQVSEVWVKRLASDGDWTGGGEWFGAKAASRDLHPIVTMDATACTSQLGVPGPAWERLPHFRPDHPPSSRGRERHSEYLVDRRHAVDAVRALYEVGERIAPALQISEIRTVKADDLWMSTAYDRECVCLHFTWTDNDADVAAAMPVVEQALKSFAPRPHWGKMHTIAPADVVAQYPRINDFRALCKRHDPDGKFRNDYLDRFMDSV